METNTQQLSFIPLGGIGDVTKNMYVYEYLDEILIVDCGLGFADETMIGVDLLLPDISYLLQTKKKIVGMLLTHGHEDHIGALPFIMPQLPQFPIFASPLTAALVNEKLKEFELPPRVQTVQFDGNDVTMGSFKASFHRVTHSVPDTSHIVIKTPMGSFYHGSDFKFDLTPADNKKTEFLKITKAGSQGIIALFSDSLGSERPGTTPTEATLAEHFEMEMKKTLGKCLVTTYSSNISRLNQVITVAEKLGRKVCFIGRSLLKAKEVAQRLGYLHLKAGMEVPLDQARKQPDNKMVFLVAGSQGQQNSAMTRIAYGEHKDVKLTDKDVVIFSSDTIPGNEVSVYSVIDTLARKGVRVMYSDVSGDFHVSGHGSQQELMMLMSLVQAKNVVPISGTARHMVAYRDLARSLGYADKNILLIENGQEIIFTRDTAKWGKKIPIRNIYVDEVTGEEVESYILRDRQKLSDGGIVIVMVEVDSQTGLAMSTPDIIIRGFTLPDGDLQQKLAAELKNTLGNKGGRVTNWMYIRKLISETSEKFFFKELRRRPLVLPVVIEV